MGWVAADVAASAALTVGGVVAAAALPHDDTVAITVVAAIACTGAVAYRRIAPATAAVVALGAVAAYQISGHDPQGAFVSIAVLLVGYGLGRWATPPRQLAVAAFALIAITAVQIDDGFSVGKDLLTWVPLVIVPLCAGALVTRRAVMAAELREKQGRLLDEHELAQARAVAEERSRVARELHDVVAHCVSVMVIQAAAARLCVRSDLAAARAAMHVVAACGRDALNDLRRLVGPRRHDDDSFAVGSPGVAQLPQLVARIRDAGSRVRLQIDVHENLPAELDLAVFRIVAEALANVRKHAPTASVEVRVELVAGTVELSVVDSGPRQPIDAPGTGNGLIGMGERVALYGGEFEAGATPSGGFAVRARLPIATPATAAGAADEPAGVRRRWRVTGWQLDALFSLAWLVPAEIDAATSAHRTGPLAWSLAAVAAIALVGVARRRMPLTFLVTVGAVAVALSGGIAAPERASFVGTYALVVGAYTVAAYCPLARAVTGLAAVVATVIVLTAVHHAAAGVAAGGALLACVSWAGGRIVRDQRVLLSGLRAVTDRLAAESAQHMLVAVQQERVRIARDLQTIVAGLVTTMVVQSEAIDELLAMDAAAAADAITVVEHTGRDALASLRTVLGVLRNPRDPAPRHPQAGVSASSDRSLATAVSP